MSRLYLPLAQAEALDHRFGAARRRGLDGPVTWEVHSGQGINLSTVKALERRGLCTVQRWPRAWEATLTGHGVNLRFHRARAAGVPRGDELGS